VLNIPFQYHLLPSSQLPIISAEDESIRVGSVSLPPSVLFFSSTILSHSPQGKDGSSLLVRSGRFACNRVNCMSVTLYPKPSSPPPITRPFSTSLPRENHQRYRSRQPYLISSSRAEASSWSIRGRMVSRRRFRSDPRCSCSCSFPNSNFVGSSFTSLTQNNVLYEWRDDCLCVLAHGTRDILTQDHDPRRNRVTTDYDGDRDGNVQRPYRLHDAGSRCQSQAVSPNDQ